MDGLFLTQESQKRQNAVLIQVVVSAINKMVQLQHQQQLTKHSRLQRKEYVSPSADKHVRTKL